MKVLLRKIHCPFICFCKSSSQIYKAGPLKLENASVPIPQQLSVSGDSGDAVAGAAIDNDQKKPSAAINAENEDEEERDIKDKDNNIISNTQNQNQNQNQNQGQRPNSGGLKSSLRKSSELDLPAPAPAYNHKKKVQWLDLLGKELAEIREFESSEAGDTEYEAVSSRGCVCSIL